MVSCIYVYYKEYRNKNRFNCDKYNVIICHNSLQ